MQKMRRKKCFAILMSIIVILGILIPTIAVSSTSYYKYENHNSINNAYDLLFNQNLSHDFNENDNNMSFLINPLSRVEIIEPDSFESPIRKYFIIKKIIWTFDDYWIHFDHYPPHPGFGGLSEQINNYGGHVNIMAIFIPPWIGEQYGNEIRNYSVIDEFSIYHPGFSQDNINLSLEFFNRPKIYPQCHGPWNHSANIGYANLSFAHKIINFSLWNWYNNYNIKPNFYLGHGSDGNYNISLALKHFSETYWNVYAEGFRTSWEDRFPNGIEPAVAYIGDSIDPYFGCSFGNPCETLEEAQQLYNDSAQEREILLIRGHPDFLDEPSHLPDLLLWQNWIDWIYHEHELININHTQAIEYKIDRENFSVEKNDEHNFTINLTRCMFNHNVLFSDPYNTSDRWILNDENGNHIGFVQNDTFLNLEKGLKYFFIKNNINNTDIDINLSIGWNLISLPVNKTIHKENLKINFIGENYTWEQAVDFNIIYPIIYTWNTDMQNYEVVDIFHIGRGYWIYANDTCTIWLNGNYNIYPDIITNLSNKWNLIGFPNNFSVIKDNLYVFYNGTMFSWDEAVDNNIILSFVYAWNNTNNNYFLTNIVYPSRGYWIYSNVFCILYHFKT